MLEYQKKLVHMDIRWDQAELDRDVINKDLTDSVMQLCSYICSLERQTDFIIEDKTLALLKEVKKLFVDILT